MRRVVVTGMGVVSPLGNSVQSSWSALLQSKSGIQQYTNDPILKNQQPFNLALVKDFEYAKWKISHAQSRLTSFLAKSTHEALESCNFSMNQIDPKRAGICIGALSSSNTKLIEQIQESSKDNFKTINRLSMLHILSNIPAATLNVKYQFKGPSLTVSTACASGLSAIVEGYKWIKLGEADFVIAGAAEDIYNPMYFYSSMRLQAMSSKIYDRPEQSSRPFDKNRSGFILGQGSGVIVLESLESAVARKAPIIAEVLSYGYTSDGHHLVRPESSGEGQARAMRQAIEMAKLNVKDIDHINVHATSTLAGDEIEARSISQVFGKDNSPTISAIKSYIGHTFASAGVIETILGLMSMKQSIVPQILNLQEVEIDLNYARETKKQEINTMLKNSFGFGGINVSCVFRRY